jgi:hypothetical protein
LNFGLWDFFYIGDFSELIINIVDYSAGFGVIYKLLPSKNEIFRPSFPGDESSHKILDPLPLKL